MTTFIPIAAKAYVDAVEMGELSSDLENDQLVALVDELEVLRTTPDGRHARAERGRLAVEIFGMNDDVETLAADVIADILHWVAITASEAHAAAAYFRAARYYGEERS